MEIARQKALEMKDKLVQDFQEIRNNFPEDFVREGTSVKQTNGNYKIVMPVPLWITDPRGEEWLQKVNIFLDHLTDTIENTDVSPEDISNEIYILFNKVSRDRTEADIDIATCSKETFVVHMVRECLYIEKLSIVCAKNWTKFAKIYTRYVMSI